MGIFRSFQVVVTGLILVSSLLADVQLAVNNTTVVSGIENIIKLTSFDDIAISIIEADKKDSKDGYSLTLESVGGFFHVNPEHTKHTPRPCFAHVVNFWIGQIV